MKEKIKKIPLLLLLLFIVFPLISLATERPSCTISFKPDIIKQGETSTECWTTKGPISKQTSKCDGILSYMGSVTQDFTDPEFLKNLNAQELINGTSNCGTIKPSKIGEGSCQFILEGPGGIGTCSASIEVISKSSGEQETSTSFKLIGNELLHSCASSDCPVIQYGTLDGIAEVIDQSGEWYKVKVTERGVWDNSIGDYGGTRRLPESMWTTMEGWFYKTLIPEDVKQTFILQQQNQTQTIEEETSTSFKQEESKNRVSLISSFLQNKNIKIIFMSFIGLYI